VGTRAVGRVAQAMQAYQSGRDLHALRPRPAQIGQGAVGFWGFGSELSAVGQIRLSRATPGTASVRQMTLK
jgi:hypothetical protein